MFSNILFSPLGSDHTLAASRRVADLANKNDAGLLFFVVDPEPSSFQLALIDSARTVSLRLAP